MKSVKYLPVDAARVEVNLPERRHFEHLMDGSIEIIIDQHS
jgi:hypothetical protein